MGFEDLNKSSKIGINGIIALAEAHGFDFELVDNGVKLIDPNGKDQVFTSKTTAGRVGRWLGYSKGGSVEEQMAMNFGDVPDNTVGVDPVSGNEIPLGSTAENVRDDIPAQLSEGEIVVPADVVRFHGVKLFEDLRAAAKMGYAQMNEDGRIGGEPIPMNGDDEGLGLELADLEVVEEMGEPQMMAAGGQPRKSYTFDQVKQRMVEKPSKPKFKNRYEELMHKFFGGDDDNKKPSKPRKPRATEKPAIDFGFSGNLSERASRKYGSPSTPTRNEPYRPNIPRPAGFDEGTGLVTSLEGKTSQILPEGFDPSVDSINAGGGVIEMREYQNAAGHTIMIPFLNGVPQTVIPEGYYPVGSVPVTVGNTTGSASGDNDDPGVKNLPEPYDYKELTIDELAEEVKNVNTPLPIGGIILNSVVSVFKDRHKKNLVEEINRRLETKTYTGPYPDSLPIYEQEYLQNLLEVVQAPKQKSMVGKIIDDITGRGKEGPDLPNLTGPSYTAETVPLSDEPYEPTTSTEEEPNPFEGSTYDEVPSPTREKAEAEEIKAPSAGLSPEIMQKVEQASREAAEKAFKTTSTPKPTPVAKRSSGEKEARKGTQDVLQSMRDRGASREERSEAMKEGARIENVRRDLDRGIVRGFQEGGLVEEKEVKEVVKGLNKASKLHAKQADQLEKALKTSKKKKKSK